ncbi:ABC transporter substrate-binding protein [Bradyrhizobium vignae]|uniref:Extracellular ligand-binding receptor n=1 Tax=Bradyrhizobium vignae TaxID=1549949 RepID=A0A2U3QAA4_9BRAD
MIAPLTGASAGDGLGLVDGHRLAVDESNAAGGVAGYKPQVVMGDTQNMSLESVTSAVQRLTNDPDLNAVSTGYADYSNFQIELMAEQDMPCLLYTSSDSTRAIIAPHPDPTIRSLNASYDAYKTAMSPVLHSLETSGKLKLQNNKVALISTDNPYSKSIINGLKKSFEEDGSTVTSADLLPTGEISDGRTFLVKVGLDNRAVVKKTDPRAGNAAKPLTRFIEQPTNSSRTFGSSRSTTASGSCFLRSSMLTANSVCRLDEAIALRPSAFPRGPPDTQTRAPAAIAK